MWLEAHTDYLIILHVFIQINEAFMLRAFWSTLSSNIPCLSVCKSICKTMSRIVISAAKIPKKMSHMQQHCLFLCPFLSLLLAWNPWTSQHFSVMFDKGRGISRIFTLHQFCSFQTPQTVSSILPRSQRAPSCTAPALNTFPSLHMSTRENLESIRSAFCHGLSELFSCLWRCTEIEEHVFFWGRIFNKLIETQVGKDP